jgi:hypothetical protein
MAYSTIAAIGTMTLAPTLVSPNTCAFMTLNNIVNFCGNIRTINQVNANATIATLPDESMFPDYPVMFPVYAGTSLVQMQVTTNGEIKPSTAIPPMTTIYLNGISFGVNSKYYTPEIGNIYNNGTSPLSEV